MDVHGLAPCHALEEIAYDLSRAGAHLDTVRLRPAQNLWRGLIPLVAHTFVLFLTASHDLIRPPSSWQLLPVGVRKVVMSVQFPTGDWQLYPETLIVNIPLPFSVKEVVVIFPPANMHQVPLPATYADVRAYALSMATSVAVLTDLVNTLVTAMSDNTPMVAYTLVDVESLPPAALGMGEASASPEGYRRSLVARVAENKRIWGADPAIIERATALIRFRTREEYRADVGSDQFIIETVL